MEIYLPVFLDQAYIFINYPTYLEIQPEEYICCLTASKNRALFINYFVYLKKITMKWIFTVSYLHI